MSIFFPNAYLYKVQEALAACGYGRGDVVEQSVSDLSTHLQVCHSQLCGNKEMQKYLREETGCPIIICSTT